MIKKQQKANKNIISTIKEAASRNPDGPETNLQIGTC